MSKVQPHVHLQDGTICLHDLRSNALQQRIQASKDEAVTSLAFQPTNEHHIWCSTGNSINLFDVRQVFRFNILLLLPAYIVHGR